jgi:hypothetical protein
MFIVDSHFWTSVVSSAFFSIWWKPEDHVFAIRRWHYLYVCFNELLSWIFCRDNNSQLWSEICMSYLVAKVAFDMCHAKKSESWLSVMQNYECHCHANFLWVTASAFRFSSFYFPFWGYTPEHPSVDKMLRCLQFNCNPVYEIISFLNRFYYEDWCVNLCCIWVFGGSYMN